MKVFNGFICMILLTNANFSFSAVQKCPDGQNMDGTCYHKPSGHHKNCLKSGKILSCPNIPDTPGPVELPVGFASLAKSKASDKNYSLAKATCYQADAGERITGEDVSNRLPNSSSFSVKKFKELFPEGLIEVDCPSQ